MSGSPNRRLSRMRSMHRSRASASAGTCTQVSANFLRAQRCRSGQQIIQLLRGQSFGRAFGERSQCICTCKTRCAHCILNFGGIADGGGMGDGFSIQHAADRLCQCGQTAPAPCRARHDRHAKLALKRRNVDANTLFARFIHQIEAYHHIRDDLKHLQNQE